MCIVKYSPASNVEAGEYKNYIRARLLHYHFFATNDVQPLLQRRKTTAEVVDGIIAIAAAYRYALNTRRSFIGDPIFPEIKNFFNQKFFCFNEKCYLCTHKVMFMVP